MPRGSYTINRKKKFAIIDKGKVISKHVDFWNAQEAVGRHFRSGKIGNSYQIVHVDALKRKRLSKVI